MEMRLSITVCKLIFAVTKLSTGFGGPITLGAVIISKFRIRCYVRDDQARIWSMLDILVSILGDS